MSAVLAGFLSLLVVAHGEEWREDLPPLPVGRQEAGVATLDRKIYVIGGIDANRAATGRVSRFNVDENRWEDVDSLPDDSRLHHVGAAAAAGAGPSAPTRIPFSMVSPSMNSVITSATTMPGPIPAMTAITARSTANTATHPI